MPGTALTPRVRTLLLAAGLVALLTGCSATGPSTAESDEAASTLVSAAGGDESGLLASSKGLDPEELERASQMVSLTETFYVPAGDRALVATAWYTAFSECAAEAGYDVPVVPVKLSDPPATLVARILFDDETRIRQYGFAMGPSVPVDEFADAEPTNSSPPLSDDAEERCKAAANDEFTYEPQLKGTSPGEWENILGEADSINQDRVLASPEYQRAFQDWQECMTDAGYPDAVNLARSYDGQPVDDDQVALALTYSRCTVQSGRGVIEFRLLAEGVRLWLAENEATAIAIQDQQAADVETAKRILNRSTVEQ